MSRLDYCTRCIHGDVKDNYACRLVLPWLRADQIACTYDPTLPEETPTQYSNRRRTRHKHASSWRVIYSHYIAINPEEFEEASRAADHGVSKLVHL